MRENLAAASPFSSFSEFCISTAQSQRLLTVKHCRQMPENWSQIILKKLLTRPLCSRGWWAALWLSPTAARFGRFLKNWSPNKTGRGDLLSCCPPLSGTCSRCWELNSINVGNFFEGTQRQFRSVWEGPFSVHYIWQFLGNSMLIVAFTSRFEWQMG